jgi:DNA-binding beta-propeller fold protein YncE
MKRLFGLGFVLFVYLICTGCGETFRPVIIPSPPLFPNPRAAHTVVSINDNGTLVRGTAMVIDVAADADVSNASVGFAPVFAAQQAANQILVVNQAVSGSQNTGDSLTQLLFSGDTIGVAFTISLPPNSAPNFVAVAPLSTTAYVTLPALKEVGVVSTQTDSLTATVPTGANPVALAVTPDNTKFYVANQGDSTISGFNTGPIIPSPRVGSPASTTSPPIWLVARSDNQRVFALEMNGTLAWLDTTSTAGPDPLTPTPISVPTAVRIVYDSNRNRLYIAGEAVVSGTLGNAVVIVDAAQTTPATIATIPITAVPPANRGADDPCSTTSVATLRTVDVAALPDGSRAYAGSYYEDSQNNICPQVTVIDAVSNTFKSSIAIPGFPAFDDFCSPTLSKRPPRFRIMMAAAGDSTRAYLSSCDGGNVNVIDTATDTYLLSLQAPISSRTVQGQQFNPPQNPVFLIAGP